MRNQPRKVAYIVWKGRNTGIFKSWHETNEQVQGFKGARFKGYETMNEAQMVWNLGFEEYEKGRLFDEEKAVRELKKSRKAPKVPKEISARAKALVKSAHGSNTFTCVVTICTYPKCACGLV